MEYKNVVHGNDPKDRRAIFLRKRYGANNAGEICGFSNATCDRLVKAGVACELDKNGKPIIPEPPPKPVTAEQALASAKKDRPLHDPSKASADPFVIDGLSAKLIESLAAVDIRHPDQIREWVSAGKELSDIKGIGATKAKLLKEMYCQDDADNDPADQSDPTDQTDDPTDQSDQSDPSNSTDPTDQLFSEDDI